MKRMKLFRILTSILVGAFVALTPRHAPAQTPNVPEPGAPGAISNTIDASPGLPDNAGQPGAAAMPMPFFPGATNAATPGLPPMFQGPPPTNLPPFFRGPPPTNFPPGTMPGIPRFSVTNLPPIPMLPDDNDSIQPRPGAITGPLSFPVSGPAFSNAPPLPPGFMGAAPGFPGPGQVPDPGPETSQPSIPVTNEAATRAVGDMQTSPDTPVGIKFESMELDEVLKQYSDWTGLAIMKAPDVPAVKVTLRCPKRIPLREALLAIEGILTMNGIGLVPMGDKFLKVVPISSAGISGLKRSGGVLDPDVSETDHLVSRIIELKYLEIAEAQGVIQQFIHPYGKITALERVNCLLITDTAINIKRILEILEMLDHPLGAREELRIFVIRHAKPSEIQSKIEAIIADVQAKDQNKIMRQPIMPSPTPRMPTPGAPPMPRADQSSQAESLDRSIIQGKVKMVSDDRTSQLIIITRPEQFAFFENIIKALDQNVEPDVSIRVFALEYAKAKDIVSVLTSLISSSSNQKAAPALPGPTPLAPPPPGTKSTTPEPTTTSSADLTISGRLSSDIKILADERSNALLVMANKADMIIIEEILAKVDVALSQVLIEVVIIEVSLKNDTETGIDWLQRSMIAYNKNNGARRAFLGFSGASREATDGTIRDATTFRKVSDDIASAGSGLSYYFTIFDLNVDAVINMLTTRTEARILSSPIILTTDNKEAKIMVGEKRPIITSTSVTTSGQQSSYEYINIGIDLTITPHINQKGFVVMDVKQKIDNTAGDVTVDNNKVPIITTREFGASLAINNGRTIVVGGLVSNERKSSESKIPLLGDIPLLGMLFRSHGKETVRGELLVLITPYVLASPTEVNIESGRRLNAMEPMSDLEKNQWAHSDLLPRATSNSVPNSTHDAENAKEQRRQKRLMNYWNSKD